MNKETKVGLLVGLSFIVLFGVILSNQAPDIAAPPEKPMLASHQPPRAGIQIVRELEPTPLPPELLAVPGAALAEASGMPAPQLPLRLDGEPAWLDTSASDASSPQSQLAAPAPQMPASPAPQMVAADLANGPEVVSDQTAADGTRTIVYVVRKGDTLSRIAREVYGRASMTEINELYQANKDLMPDKRTLQVGWEIQVPVEANRKIESLLASGHFEMADSAEALPAAATASAVGASTGQAPRVVQPAAVDRSQLDRYQVRKGDTWYKLAGRFMGNSSRWRELYALNDDIVPDINRLRTGVKIRVPAHNGIALASRTVIE